MKFIFSFIIALLLCTTITTSVLAQAADKTITVKVKGITCTTDLKMIQSSVKKIDGVSECIVSKEGATTRFNITFNPIATTVKELHAAIEGTASCENPTERPYKVKP